MFSPICIIAVPESNMRSESKIPIQSFYVEKLVMDFIKASNLKPSPSGGEKKFKGRTVIETISSKGRLLFWQNRYTIP